ncbi:MAG TPA: ROK family protein [archaeon]|nr:ROK family protein [archaeon]
MEVYVGVDLGGTKTMIASADEKGEISKKVEFATPLNFEQGLKLIKDGIKEVAGKEKILGIGCSAGGPLNYRTGVISPLHQPEWRNIPLKEIIEKEFGCKFYVDVDTNITALGEMVFGEGKNYSNFIYITISTGFGAGIVIDKKIYRGLEEGHPELGHQEVKWGIDHVKDDVVCKCGAKNCLESLVSGSAIKRLYGKPAEDLSQKEWEEVGENLGRGLRNIIIMFAPEAILLGGGVSIKAGEKVLKPAVDYVRKNVKIVSKLPIIKNTSLGYEASLMGSVAAAIKVAKGELDG